MKTIIYILRFLVPILGSAQQSWYKISPMDYMWQNVGVAGFSADEADYISLAVSSNGQPYIAFTDWGNSYKATVMKFDGINWVNVGNAGFSSGGVQFISLALDVFDQPY